MPQGNKKNLNTYTKKALKAYSEGKTNAGDRILENLKRAGITQNDIDSKTKTALKDWPEIEEAAEKLLDGDLEGYEEMVNEFSAGIDKGLVIDVIHSVAEKKQKEPEKETEEKEAEEKTEPMLYEVGDIKRALDAGNEKSANKIIDYIYKEKKK